MDPLLATLRLVHIAGGVYWAGAIFFTVLFLEPSVRAAGPDGAKVMQGIQQRKFMVITPIVALLTLISGFWLYWRMGWMSPGAASSPIAMTLGAGGIAASVAFVIGYFVTRPAMLRAGALAAAVPPTPDGPDKQALMAQIDRLRTRARVSGRWVAAFLAVAVFTMAVGRYV